MCVQTYIIEHDIFTFVCRKFYTSRHLYAPVYVFGETNTNISHRCRSMYDISYNIYCLVHPDHIDHSMVTVSHIIYNTSSLVLTIRVHQSEPYFLTSFHPQTLVTLLMKTPLPFYHHHQNAKEFYYII